MAYASTTFAQMRNLLAQRLNDVGKVFTTDGELKVHCWNAMRLYNALTGDNKLWYNLSTDPGHVWYDLLTILDSPQRATLTDQDVYSWIQYMFLESQLSQGAMSSGQYQASDVVNSVQHNRDDFLFKSRCTSSVELLPVLPNTAQVPVPSDYIQVTRAYWLPGQTQAPGSGGAVRLVQSNLGGSFTSANVGTTATISGAFSNPTTPGNFLLIVVYSDLQNTSNSFGDFPAQVTSVTGGLTWGILQPSVATYQTFPNSPLTLPQNVGAVAIIEARNAASIGPGDTITVHLNTGASGIDVGTHFQGQMVMYEFSGVSPTGAFIDAVSIRNNQSNSNTTDPGNLVCTNAGDLIISVGSGDPTQSGQNVSAGPGFTLGINANVALQGQMQWKAGAVVGDNTVAFGGTISTSWGAVAYAFLPSSSPPPVPVSLGTAQPLRPSDDFSVISFASDDLTKPGNPRTYSAGVEPELTLDLNPPPGFPGSVELNSIQSQPVLNPALSSTVMLIPNDFFPGLMWGAMADLMNMTAEKKDDPRAVYCQQRYAQHAEMMLAYPVIMSARFQGAVISVDAVEVLDLYRPFWRTAASTPATVGLSGKNLVALPNSAASLVNLFMLGSAVLPVADGDFVQYGQEVINVLLDYAQHEATFKQGWYEFNQTMPLFGNIVKFAAKRNAKVRAMATYRDILYGKVQRESQVQPQEVAQAQSQGDE